MSPRKVSVETITIITDDIYSYERFVSDLEVDTEKEVSYQYSHKKGVRDDAHFAGVSMNYKGVLEPTATQTIYLYFLHMLGVKCFTLFDIQQQKKTGPKVPLCKRIKTAIISNEHAMDRLIREDGGKASQFHEIVFRCDDERLNRIQEKFSKIVAEMDAPTLSDITQKLSEIMKTSFKTREPFDVEEISEELSPKFEGVELEEWKDCLEFAREFMNLMTA